MTENGMTSKVGIPTDSEAQKSQGYSDRCGGGDGRTGWVNNESLIHLLNPEKVV